MDLTGFYLAQSRVMDSIDRDERSWGGYTIVSVVYSDKKSKNPKVYTCFYWATIDEYDALVNAPSQFSEYYHNWSAYGMPATWYYNQDFGTEPDNPDEQRERTDSGGDDSINVSSITFEDYQNMLDSKENGTYGEWKTSRNMNELEEKDFEKFLGRMEGMSNLYERTMQIRELIMTEQLTSKQMFKVIFSDIEEMFGISIQRKIKFQILNGVDVGKLSPQNFVKYKNKIKNIYSVLEEDGIKGAGQIGQRFINSKNPLIRNRYAYKGKEALKSMAKKKSTFTGNEAVTEIQKFHNKVLKEQANGIMKKNHRYLERKVLESGVEEYTWVTNATFGRKIIRGAKKVLRIAKWFII